MSTEDDLYSMSDEELEQAFKAAKADEVSPDTDLEADQPIEGDGEPTEPEGVDDVPSVDIENSDLEQPPEDSNHDTSAEQATKDAEADADIPEESNDPDEGDQPADVTEPKVEAPQEAQRLTFKANGKEYEFTPDEITAQFPKIFGQAMDYTKKLQAIKPWRKTVDAIEQAGLKQDDINLMIDVLKGDKDAITEVLNRTGVDALDLDPEESTYTPKDYGRDEHTLEIEDVIQDIAKDPEYSTTYDVLTNQWDESSLQAITANPSNIKALHEDVRNGTYAKLQPIMDKLKLYDGGSKSDLDYYGMAAREYFGNVAQEQQTAAIQRQEAPTVSTEEAERVSKAKAQEAARKATQQASAKRKAAAPTKTRAGSSTVVDYLDESDEAFEEWYTKVTGEKPIN